MFICQTMRPDTHQKTEKLLDVLAQEDAAARNAQRAEADHVPQEVLNRMAARLEPPCPSKYAWECGTVIVPAKELPTPDDPCDQACWFPEPPFLPQMLQQMDIVSNSIQALSCTGHL